MTYLCLCYSDTVKKKLLFPLLFTLTIKITNVKTAFKNMSLQFVKGSWSTLYFRARSYEDVIHVEVEQHEDDDLYEQECNC